jgi:hypothetical protein
MKIIYQCSCGRRVRPRMKEPPRTHEVLYYEFVNRALGGIPGLPEYGKRYRRLVRVTAKKHNWFIPIARGTKHDLVPPPGSYPCDLCANASYNQLCAKQDDCLPYAYWATTHAGGLSADGRESIESKFNIKLKKEKTCGAKPAASSRRT